MRVILLTRGYLAVVDDVDFEVVSEFKWCAERRGRRIYAAHKKKTIEGAKTTEYLHQFLMPGVARIDHEDGDGLNNRRGNLRPATHSQNAQGFQRKQRGRSSQFRGVYWDARREKWAAQIVAEGKHLFCGYFDSEVSAAQAYDAFAREKFGVWAAPNFV